MAALLRSAFLRIGGGAEGSSDESDSYADHQTGFCGSSSAASDLSVSSSGDLAAAERWHCSRLCRTAVAVATPVGQAALLVLAVVPPGATALCRSVLSQRMFLSTSMVIYVFAVAYEHTSRNARDSVTERAKAYAFLVAAYLLLMGYQSVFEAGCGVESGVLLDVLTIACDQVCSLLFAIVVFLFFGVVEERLRLTEIGFGQRLGSLCVRRIRFATLGLELLPEALSVYAITSWATGRPRSIGGIQWWRLQLHNALYTASYLAVGLVAFRGFTLVLRSLELRSLPPASYAWREGQWTQSVFQRLRWIALLQCSCSSALHLLQVAIICRHMFCPRAFFVWSIVQPPLFLAELLFLLAVTGLLRPKRWAEPRPGGAGAPPPAAAPARTSTWRATTEALAGRGLSAGALLDFYELLGRPDGPMPRYRPDASTTNDVVRQAIIPLSKTAADGGVAYADLAADEERSPPQVMVTHTWSGLFLDLVAAVVADAHGLDEYESTAADLACGDCERLRRALERHGTSGRRYWICAFCVNQHSCICDSVGRPPASSSTGYARWDSGRRDRASGDVFPLCACSQPKYLNESNPEECELNKFDDMIELLSLRAGGFAQLVAVDRDYSVFTRAWCVAELHRAHAMGLSQKVCMRTNGVLDIGAGDLAVYQKLATLTVTSCEASRPQDKEDILRKIPDTQEFDEQLQEAIFGGRGILRRQFESFGILEAAARTAFRVSRMRSDLLQSDGAAVNV